MVVSREDRAGDQLALPFNLPSAEAFGGALPGLVGKRPGEKALSCGVSYAIGPCMGAASAARRADTSRAWPKDR
jgi:hypothetical protein